MLLVSCLLKDGMENKGECSKCMNSTHSESLCSSAHLETE